jgi:hypothetical protein
MKRNPCKILLCLSSLALFSCAGTNEKAITIDDAQTLLATCLTKDSSATLSGTSYTFTSTITAPKDLQADLPYLSLKVVYSNATTYLTNIARVTASGTDNYAVTKSIDSSSGKTTYFLARNGADPAAYDPINDAYLANFFELPTYLLNENIYGLNGATTLLGQVQNKAENHLSSYNLYSSGGGQLNMTLRGSALDFTALFTETPQINTNVTSIHFQLENYLMTALEADYLVAPSTSATGNFTLPQGQTAALSSSEGSLCTITMGLSYQ